VPTQFIDRDDIPMGSSPAPAGHAKIKVNGDKSILEWKGGDGVVHGLPGYGTLGTVSQTVSKATGVTLNSSMGQITMNAATLAAATAVSFTLTDNKIGANDVLVFNHVSGGTIGAYSFNAVAGIGSASIAVRNETAVDLAEAIVVRFAVIKGAA
jgi:hypothetical protein